MTPWRTPSAWWPQATGTQDQAETLIADMEARTQAVLEKTSGLAEEDKPSVYWAVSFGEYGDYTVGPGSFPDEIIRMAGGVNVSGESEFAWPMYSPEQIVADDPDLIIIPGDEAMKESFLATESYQTLTAVKGGKVYWCGRRHRFQARPPSGGRPGSRVRHPPSGG